MIKRLIVNPILEQGVDRFLRLNNIAERGYGDGNFEQQKAGKIGELVVINYLTGRYPPLRSGFDNGVDVEHNGIRIDIKTLRVKKTYSAPDRQHCFYAYQAEYKTDVIVFCSYIESERIVEICGWIEKEKLIVPERFRPKGTIETRGSGNKRWYFEFKHDDYVIKNSELKNIELLCRTAYIK